MPSTQSTSIVEHFADLTDPRRREGTYPLINFVVIGVCAVICGADDFVAMAEYGRTKKKFLEQAEHLVFTRRQICRQGCVGVSGARSRMGNR